MTSMTRWIINGQSLEIDRDSIEQLQFMSRLKGVPFDQYVLNYFGQNTQSNTIE